MLTSLVVASMRSIIAIVSTIIFAFPLQQQPQLGPKLAPVQSENSANNVQLTEESESVTPQLAEDVGDLDPPLEIDPNRCDEGTQLICQDNNSAATCRCCEAGQQVTCQKDSNGNLLCECAGCKYHTISAQFFFNGDGFEHWSSMFSPTKGTKEASLEKFYALPCMRKLFETCGYNEDEVPLKVGFEMIRDDCVYMQLGNMWAKANGKSATYCGNLSEKNKEYLEKIRLLSAQTGQSDTLLARDKTQGVLIPGTCRESNSINLTLNDSCEVVKEQIAPKDICGYYNAVALHSPISLQWKENITIESISSITSFPIVPHQNNLWYSWRASADTPLLVFDPTHQGKITSGAQLFGEWTWGGQRSAALSTSSAPPPRPWKNGFEALKQLDANNNGRVDGKELSPLALWFDENQDGVSAHGEVVPIEQTQVTALFFEPAYFEPRSQSLTVKLGFERMTKDGLSRGKAIDWYAESFGTKLQALIKTQVQLEDTPIPNPAIEEIPPGAFLDPMAAHKFSGSWEWSLTDQQNSRGYLMLFAQSNGEVEGKIILESPILNEKHKNPYQTVTILPFTGRVLKIGDKPRLEYQIKNGNQVLSRSSVSLSNDETSLHGETTIGPPRAFSKTMKSAHYTWLARRVALPELKE